VLRSWEGLWFRDAKALCVSNHHVQTLQHQPTHLFAVRLPWPVQLPQLLLVAHLLLLSQLALLLLLLPLLDHRHSPLHTLEVDNSAALQQGR
jgi:hypothetical protein